jgi:RND family efflux transporter MFP subunit
VALALVVAEVVSQRETSMRHGNPAIIKNIVWVAGFALAGALTACGGEPEVVAVPPPEVSVSRPVERSVADYFETTGRTEAVESVDVQARVSGYLLNVDFEDGAEVKRGQELFLIDPREYEAQVLAADAELARWKAQLRQAEAEVARNQRLLPKGATSERELERWIASRDSASAEIQASEARLAEAELDLEFTRVTAPIDGRVSRTNITEGNLIQAEESIVLTTLVSVDPIYVYFDMDERTLLEQRARNREAGGSSRASDIEALQIPVEISLANEDGYHHRGILDFVDNRVDPSTGTLKARAVLSNADRALEPGLFVRVRLPLGEPRPSLLVTDRAVGTDQGNKFLYVVNDKDVAEYRAVKLGPVTDDGLRVVSQGLEAGERIVINGIQRVRPGLTVTPQNTSMLPPQGAAAPAS